MASPDVRFAVGLPNLREYADPRRFAQFAAETEAAGWDGLFVWDHLADRDPSVAATDPWIATAAAATRTETLRLGIMVTPLARRRPWKVARESVAMDLLSDGRFHLGVGLGGDGDAEFANFGESADPRVRAERLDEALDVLCGLWSGKPFAFDGQHFSVRAQFTPVPIQFRNVNRLRALPMLGRYGFAAEIWLGQGAEMLAQRPHTFLEN